MKLFFRQSGQGLPLIILHGLFGSSDNWFTLAKTFAEKYSVYLVDQRNHGQSPQSDAFNYTLMCDDLLEFIEDQHLIDPIIIGHSMGGKTAMNFAVRYPEKIKKLIVVDIAPKLYPIHHDHILEGLNSIPLATLTSRNEADQLLSRFVPEADVRQFLLKNLSRKADNGFEWKINLAAIANHIEEIGEGMQHAGTFSKPTLFIKGVRSNYFVQDDEQKIKSIFTKAQLISIDTGHWVQAEKPVEFAKCVLNFLNE